MLVRSSSSRTVVVAVVAICRAFVVVAAVAI